MKSSNTPRPSRSAVKSVKSKGDTWQAEKSQMTRTAILDATIQCLVQLGYAQTTTEKIASQAGVSRGAMTHHFKSRAEVFDAAAGYIIEKRAAEYERLIRSIVVPPGTLPGLQHMRDTITVCHRYYSSPTFIALHELLRGARTDKELKSSITTLEKSLDQKIADAMLKQFPYLAVVEDTRELLTDLIMTTLQGVAVDMAPHLKKGKRLERLLDLLASIATREFTDAYESANAGKRNSRAVKAAA